MYIFDVDNYWCRRGLKSWEKAISWLTVCLDSMFIKYVISFLVLPCSSNGLNDLAYRNKQALARLLLNAWIILNKIRKEWTFNKVSLLWHYCVVLTSATFHERPVFKRIANFLWQHKTNKYSMNSNWTKSTLAQGHLSWFASFIICFFPCTV
jgi:hypothetical protein